ncbi:MAG: class B sortase [Lachnospiraceae bacterium]|jgi:sortase B|nr:class B sortase [Lachnospiraceae bacterium]
MALLLAADDLAGAEAGRRLQEAVKLQVSPPSEVGNAAILRAAQARAPAEEAASAAGTVTAAEAVTAAESVPTYQGQVSGTSRAAPDPASSDMFFPDPGMDPAALARINPDFACVLYIPSLDLLYPVAYSADNTEYLSRSFDGLPSVSGSLFVDCLASRGFTDPRTLIFGHNMKNGTMFGSLKRFAGDPALCLSDPYLYLYEKGTACRYRIFSCHIAAPDSFVYAPVRNEAERRQYIAAALSASSLTGYSGGDIDFPGAGGILTLSTCQGISHREYFVVHAVKVAEKKTAGQQAPR